MAGAKAVGRLEKRRANGDQGHSEDRQSGENGRARLPAANGSK